jgi:hypothetical protein
MSSANSVGTKATQCPVKRGEDLVAPDLGPYCDKCPPATFQDAARFAQRQRPVGEELQPLLAHQHIERLGKRRQRRGRGFNVFDRGRGARHGLCSRNSFRCTDTCCVTATNAATQENSHEQRTDARSPH